jgi:RNA polymerase sigma-70 factor (ECF subfamily)
VQEGLLRAWRGIGRHRGEAAFATWLHAIVTRECLRAMAKRRRSHRAHELTDDELRRAERADPARIADQVADRDALLGALALLPPAQRAAVVLHDVEELTAGEIADLTGVPLGTAKSRIRQGRLALLVHLTEEDPR